MILCICLVFVSLQKIGQKSDFHERIIQKQIIALQSMQGGCSLMWGGKAVVAMWQDDKKPTHRTLTVPTL